MRKIGIIISIVLLYALLLLFGTRKDLRISFHNVEERDYATVLMISPEREHEYVLGIAKEKRVGEKNLNETVYTFQETSLENLRKAYRNHRGKELSLAHLKCIVLSEEMRREEIFSSLVSELKTDHEIAKTCPLVVTKDVAEMTAFMEEQKQPTADYLKILTENAAKDFKIPEIKDYIKAQYQDEETYWVWLLKDSNGLYFSKGTGK